MMDLVSRESGGRIVACNDEFFAEAVNLINSAPPVWKEGVYTDSGKWMDGWETRRRRQPGHDWCVIDLGIPGVIRRVTVDTSYFTGNYPEEFSLEVSAGDDEWHEVLGRTPLSGDTVASFDVDFPNRVTRVRLNIYPDGGVARLRLEGDPVPSIELVCGEPPVDLVGAVVGGRFLEATDYHYSSPANLLLPTDSAGMWDGWETRRRRGPGHDWASFELGMPGTIEEVVVDTTHFKGNSPGWVSLEVSEDATSWRMAIEEAPVEADTINTLSVAQAHARFVRLSLHPDGGVARLRVLGRADPVAATERRLDYLNRLLPTEARRFLLAACGAERFVDEMMAARPFVDVDSVLQRAETVFATLGETDWLEAFAAHPRIGERGGSVENREQAGASGHEIELAEVNALYEEKFGFIYIVYASGKTGEELVGLARTRLDNDRGTELESASTEQRKITATRLRRMLCQEDT